MYDYCERPEFFSGSWPVARKEHKCCECGQTIFIGEKYGSFTGKWDGDVDTNKQHLECEEACRYLRDFITDGECIPFGGLHDDCWDMPSFKTGQNNKDFRSVFAKALWRKKKGRPLTFFKPREIINKSLNNDRARKYV